MKRLLAAILTIALMAALAWTGSRRADSRRDSPAGGPDAADPVELRIQALLQSAWDGDVAGYLASFGDPVRKRLEREVGERGRDAFAADLRRTARSRKSHAVFVPEPDGPDAARVTVETVYPDRNERQTYRVEQQTGGWVVTDVETVRSHQPKAKFGAPAVYQEPEGVPVQSGGLTVETGEESEGQPP